MSEDGTYQVSCDHCGMDESFDSLSSAVEAVERHRSEKGCLYPVDTNIELPNTETEQEDSA